MKRELYFTIAFRIMLLMSFGFLMTFITPQLRTLFEDVLLAKPQVMGVDCNYEWGIRHYWYFYAMVLLFILSLIDSIMVIAKAIKKHYP